MLLGQLAQFRAEGIEFIVLDAYLGERNRYIIVVFYFLPELSQQLISTAHHRQQALPPIIVIIKGAQLACHLLKLFN